MIETKNALDVKMWRVTAASERGSSHEKLNQPCQDANAWHETIAGFLVVAVADGAGSAPMSERGASIAVKTAVDSVCSGLVALNPADETQQLQQIMRKAASSARQAITAEASSQGIDVRDLASTLIVVALTPTATAAIQIGDGAAVAFDVDGGVWGLTTPQNGEYANETTFLISAGALETAQVSVHQKAADAISVFSDGLQMLALDMSEGTPYEPYEPFFKPLFRFIKETPNESDANKQLAQFLNSARVRDRADDDLTLLLATRVG